ncbi:hypothetical protein HanIR_Chr16g0812331 [Helianthus annuus]|nr:hypothetical protein HanIR_Chr16g0812331 [Helianthus annuus]
MINNYFLLLFNNKINVIFNIINRMEIKLFYNPKKGIIVVKNKCMLITQAPKTRNKL